MGYLLGLLIALLSIIASIIHLQQSANLYFDFVGFMVVFGGVAAVTVVSLPWRYWREIVECAKTLFYSEPVKNQLVVKAGMELVQSAQANSLHSYKSRQATLASEILNDGAELLALGLPVDNVETILRERIHQHMERYHTVVNALRSLSKYPPAFGLVGTVLGLVSLMRAVSNGAQTQETGMRMAVALVATLYGLITANLLINPAAESISKYLLYMNQSAEIALHSVLLAGERISLLESQEMLNSYLPKNERISVLGSVGEEAKGAA